MLILTAEWTDHIWAQTMCSNLLDLTWDEVEESHTKNNEKHLLTETDDISQASIIKCFSKERMKKQYFFSCSCIDSESIFNLKSVYELILILSSAELLETWQQKFNDSIDESDSRVEMTLFVAHQSEKSCQIITSEQINSHQCDNSDEEFLSKDDQTWYIMLIISHFINTHMQSKLKHEIWWTAVTDNWDRNSKAVCHL
jgi:dsDNA-binding SOS-regulon protein